MHWMELSNGQKDMWKTFCTWLILGPFWNHTWNQLHLLPRTIKSQSSLMPKRGKPKFITNTDCYANPTLYWKRFIFLWISLCCMPSALQGKRCILSTCCYEPFTSFSAIRGKTHINEDCTSNILLFFGGGAAGVVGALVLCTRQNKVISHFKMDI